MRSFGICFAKNVNGGLAARGGRPRRGAVLADRYHVVTLTTPGQVRAALAYVLGNWRRHGEDVRLPGPPRSTDRYSSGPYFTGWTIPPPPLIAVADLPFPDLGCLPVRFPTSWLLSEGGSSTGASRHGAGRVGSRPAEAMSGRSRAGLPGRRAQDRRRWGMGKLARIALLCLAVGGCVKRKVSVEPFQPAEVAADGESLRRAFETMKWFGLEPVVDAGEAFGADAPISTPWEIAGAYHTRWLLYVRDGKLHVTSVCFMEVRTEATTPAAGATLVGPTSTTSLVRCAAQPMGRSKVAAELAAEIGVRAAPPPPPPTDVEPPSEAPPAAID